MARAVSWSPDSKSLFAGVAEVDADIVIVEGLVT